MSLLRDAKRMRLAHMLAETRQEVEKNALSLKGRVDQHLQRLTAIRDELAADDSFTDADKADVDAVLQIMSTTIEEVADGLKRQVDETING